MKKCYLLFNAFLCVLLSCSVSHAQMHIYKDGRIMVGNTNHPNDDLEHVLKLSIQGDQGYFNYGAKLGFGDFGRKSHIAWNVFIGEWGDYDSDILWLHGKNGIRMTTWDGSYTIMEWGCDSGNVSNFIVYDPINTDRIFFSSDMHQVANIHITEHALDRISLLHSYQYVYRSPYPNTPVIISKEMSDKEYSDALRMHDAMDEHKHTSIRYGLNADEVRDLFPELVTRDANGLQYINYVEMIPILIAAIQELQGIQLPSLPNGINNATEQDIFQQTDSISTFQLPNLTSSLSLQNNTDEAYLYQNSPNPFYEQTDIRYYVPQDATSAEIFIFTLDGRLRKSITLTALGNGVITVDNSDLEPGMYLYTLVVDDLIIDNKQMILTQ